MRVERIEASRVAIISDIHLAHAGAPMGFSGDDSSLAATLERLAATHERVIINGDLYDLDRGRWPWSFDEERAASDRAYPATTSVVRSSAFTLISGNHDLRLRWVDAVEVLGERHRAWVEHGHRFDAPIKQYRGFARLVTWTSGKVAGIPPLLNSMRWMEQTLTRSADSKRGDCPIERGAGAFIEGHPELDIVVLGHTHQETMSSWRGTWIVNPGPSLSRPYRWTSIDLAQGIVCNFEGDSTQSFEVRRAVLASRTSDCQE